MQQVLDYSAGFPGALSIKAAGYAGAVRYIGLPDRRKCTTAGELNDFLRNGLGMALVFEEAAGNWRYGYDRGLADARKARNHANAIGFSAELPIYMAIDEDVVTPAEFNTMIQYLRGSAATLGGTDKTGVYGEADVIDRARDAGAASWFWQTKAWSRGRITVAHLRQNIGTVNVGGIGCDINEVLEPNWGQMGRVSSMADMTQAQWNAFMDAYYESKTTAKDSPTGGRNWRDLDLQAGSWTAETLQLLQKLVKDGFPVNVTFKPDADQINAMTQQISTNVIAALPPGGATKQDVHDVVSDVMASVTFKVNE